MLEVVVATLVTYRKLKAAENIAGPSFQAYVFSTAGGRYAHRIRGRAVLRDGRDPCIRLARLVRRHDCVVIYWNVYTVAVHTEK